MKKIYKIGFLIFALIISQQIFPQKENTKSPLTGEQQIELSEGYSFISSRINAENPNLQDILQNNLANLEFVRNSAGLMLRKIGPNWVNSIGDWVNTEGYLFKMSSGDDLIITGDVIDPQTPVELSIGYQIIGYLPDEALNTEDVFQDVLDNLEFVRNTAGLMLRKIGPVWVNSIGDMQPCEGYLVKMLADDILIYPASSSFTCGDPVTDPRDGQTYNTVIIGDQCWMAESLNIGTMISGSSNMANNGEIEKYCYDNSTANCDEYGVLYQWNEMMQYTTTPGVQGVCPTGWHLPTDTEWFTMEHELDPTITPNSTEWRGVDGGGKLKETGTTHWNSPNTGATNSSGFTALAVGTRLSTGGFGDIGKRSNFWTSSEYGSLKWMRKLYYTTAMIGRYGDSPSNGLSIRCLKDFLNQPPGQPSSPIPENGAEYQSIEVDISWTCTDPEGDPLSYDIYFGTETTPPLVNTGQTETTYDPGTLENNTEYFWKIVAQDDHNNTTEGPVWNFNTGSGGQWYCGIPFTDPRDDQTYNSIQIGDQCWMAENLNIGIMINGSNNQTDNSIIEKYCYDNSTANCDEYGGLYQWNEMMQYTTTQGMQGICPADWHLPTDGEWTILTDLLGGLDVAGGKMKETGTSHWVSPNTGATNESGFTALPGGFCIVSAGVFLYLGQSGYWLSSTEYSETNAWYRSLSYNNNIVNHDNITKFSGFSVRCLKDDFTPVNQPPEPPSAPIPENGAEYQTIEVDISWTCTDPDGDPLTYDVYFGTVNPPPLVATGQTETTYDPGTLENIKEYFWMIVAHDDHSNSTTGPVWSFTTGVNYPPAQPSNPSPEDGAENQPTELDLSWICTDPEGDPLTYDIYFGTVDPPPLVYSGQALTTYYPGILEYNTEYFWIIEAHDNHNNSTVGPGWNFITETENTHPPCPGIPTVTYGGQVYNTILIGEQCWLKENLNIGTYINGAIEMTDNGVIEKYCYTPSSCDVYGGLYQWDEMMGYSTTPGVQGICPSDWHIPTDAEWFILTEFLEESVGGKMKETGTVHWASPNTGATNESWFTGLPGGYRTNNGYFFDSPYYAKFWSSNEYNDYQAWGRDLSYNNDNVARNSYYDIFGFSVRCMKGAPPVNQPPNPPELPIPEDGAVNQPIEPELSWDCTDPEGDPLTYDVYFGTVNPPPLVYSGQSLTTYYPGILEANTEYFWWIMAHDNHSNSTYGPDWSFTTHPPCPETVAYFGQVYNTVLIGEQCWMAENLNIGDMINGTENMTDDIVIEKYCYDNNYDNCDEYGGLYQWNEMMEYSTTPGVQGICPDDWHLPTDAEWNILTDFLGGLDVAGGKMKETGTVHWASPNTGATNESGFSGLPGGHRDTDGYFNYIGLYGYFWSSTEYSTSNAWLRELPYHSANAYRNNYSKEYGFSVRCIRDF